MNKGVIRLAVHVLLKNLDIDHFWSAPVTGSFLLPQMIMNTSNYEILKSIFGGVEQLHTEYNWFQSSNPNPCDGWRFVKCDDETNANIVKLGDFGNVGYANETVNCTWKTSWPPYLKELFFSRPGFVINLEFDSLRSVPSLTNLTSLRLHDTKLNGNFDFGVIKQAMPNLNYIDLNKNEFTLVSFDGLGDTYIDIEIDQWYGQSFQCNIDEFIDNSNSKIGICDGQYAIDCTNENECRSQCDCYLFSSDWQPNMYDYTTYVIIILINIF